MSARRSLFSFLALAAIAGCAAPKSDATAPPSVGPLEVDVSDGAQDDSLTVDALRSRVDAQLARGAYALAETTVARHADVAQAALASKPTETLGELFDRVTGADPVDAPVVLAIESARREGAAHVVAARFDEAERAFGRGADAARSRPFERANLLLLRSGAAAHAGNHGAARRAWREAVEQAAALASSPYRVCDPSFWHRAQNLRVREEPWPDAALARIADVCRRDIGTRVGGDERAERADELLWTMIGAQRLARDERRAALVAFGRAEAQARDAAARSALRLAQAEALARLDDRSSAQALLTSLATDPAPEIARAACALLGAIELEQGRTARGVTLLERAVTQEPQVDWPQRGRAEANLGLAKLLLGDESEGLRRLSAAKARFEADRAFDDLDQCLGNEREYARAARLD